MNTFQTQGRDKWAEYIGKTMLCFGDIEFITFECLINFSRDNIFQSTSKMNLNPRIDLIINIIKSRFNDDESSELIMLLKETKNLADKRNLIAHNPLSFDIYEDEMGKISEFTEVINSLKNYDNKISFNELVLFYESTLALSKKLTNEYHSLYNKLVLV
jgi:hypothetical protein